MRRLLLPFAIAAVLLVAGCGDERPGAVRDAGATFSAAPSTDPTPSTSRPTPTPTPASATSPAAPTGPLASFPLDLGYADENGDDHSPVVVTDQPGLHRFDLCGRVVWDPWAGTTNLIGAEFRGEAEWARGRTLVLYPTVLAATAAVEGARDTVEDCGEEVLGDDYDYVAVHTIYDDIRLGDQSLVWTATGGFRQHGQIQFDTGLTVYHLVRVGRAVLGSYEYGEGNGGGPEVRSPAIDLATHADQPVVDLMRSLADSTS